MSTFQNILILIGGFILLFIAQPLNAQKDSINIEHKAFDKATYQKAIEGVDYTETYQPKKQKPNKRRSRKFNGFNPDFSILGEVFKVLAIISIVLLLGFLVFKLLDEKLSLTGKSIPKGDLLFEKLEEHIHDVDLHALLQEALARKEYKLAIRIYYLIIIKQLSDQSLIHWKKDKTNGTYVTEMFGKSQFEPFRNATNVFERIWYGDVAIDAQRYQKVIPQFEELSKNLQPKKPVSE